jgi:hypothetical protein
MKASESATGQEEPGDSQAEQADGRENQGSVQRQGNPWLVSCSPAAVRTERVRCTVRLRYGGPARDIDIHPVWL